MRKGFGRMDEGVISALTRGLYPAFNTRANGRFGRTFLEETTEIAMRISKHFGS